MMIQTFLDFYAVAGLCNKLSFSPVISTHVPARSRYSYFWFTFQLLGTRNSELFVLEIYAEYYDHHPAGVEECVAFRVKVSFHLRLLDYFGQKLEQLLRSRGELEETSASCVE